MSKRVYELFLFDVYIAIIKIEIVSSKFNDAEALLHDFISWDSIIREFEIVGEATKILIDNKIVDSKYRIVVDFRNKIIHHYFGIDADGVWSIIHNDLLDFKTHIKEKILEIENEKFKIIFNSVLEDNKNYITIIKKLNELNWKT